MFCCWLLFYKAKGKHAIQKFDPRLHKSLEETSTTCVSGILDIQENWSPSLYMAYIFLFTGFPVCSVTCDSKKWHVPPCCLVSHSSTKIIIYMHYSLFVLGSLRAEDPVFILPSYGMCFGYKTCSLNPSGIFHSFVNLRRGKMERCPLASSSLAYFFCGFQGKNVKIDQEIWWQVSFQLQLHALSC